MDVTENYSHSNRLLLIHELHRRNFNEIKVNDSPYHVMEPPPPSTTSSSFNAACRCRLVKKISKSSIGPGRPSNISSSPSSKSLPTKPKQLTMSQPTSSLPARSLRVKCSKSLVPSSSRSIHASSLFSWPSSLCTLMFNSNFVSTLLTVILITSGLFGIAEACSARSTPKPRPPSPTLRPNITFQTYACPEAYAKWYCLNGATCFSVRIGESILYNCECADGYMGQRCEFKDLDGSYSKDRLIVEKAGLFGGAAVVLLFAVLFVTLTLKNKNSRLVGESGKSHHHHYPPPYLEPHDFQVGRVGNPEMICVGGSTSGGGGGGRDRKNLFSSLKGPAPTTPSLFGHQIQQTAPKRHHYLHQQHVVSIDVKDEEDDRMKFSQQLSMRESTEKPALHSSVQSSTPLSLLFLFKSGISGPQPPRNTEETLSNLASNTNTNDDDEQNCQKRLEKKANKDRNDMTKEQPTNTGRLAFLLSSPPSSCFPTSEPLLIPLSCPVNPGSGRSHHHHQTTLSTTQNCIDLIHEARVTDESYHYQPIYPDVTKKKKDPLSKENPGEFALIDSIEMEHHDPSLFPRQHHLLHPPSSSWFSPSSSSFPPQHPLLFALSDLGNNSRNYPRARGPP